MSVVRAIGASTPVRRRKWLPAAAALVTVAMWAVATPAQAAHAPPGRRPSPRFFHDSTHAGAFPWWGWAYIALVGGSFFFGVVVLIWRRIRAWRNPGVVADEEVTSEDETGDDTLYGISSTDEVYNMVVQRGR